MHRHFVRINCIGGVPSIGWWRLASSLTSEMQRAVNERFTPNDVIKLSTSYDFCATLKKTTKRRNWRRSWRLSAWCSKMDDVCQVRFNQNNISYLRFVRISGCASLFALRFYFPSKNLKISDLKISNLSRNSQKPFLENMWWGVPPFPLADISLNPKFRSRNDPFLIGRGLAVARPDWSTNGYGQLYWGKNGKNPGVNSQNSNSFPPKTGRSQCIQGKKTMKYSVDFSTLASSRKSGTTAWDATLRDGRLRCFCFFPQKNMSLLPDTRKSEGNQNG
jgi:hypothetical protein